MRSCFSLVFAAVVLFSSAFAQTPTRIVEIASEDGARFGVHVFEPAPRQAPSAAIVLFHGGGWFMGDASWVYARAAQYAERGALAVAVDYRLANQRDLTPAHSNADARATFRWLRANATTMHIDPNRIAAYGVSAGGQLAASAAQSNDPNARPNASVLVSPALDLERDSWFVRLMGGAEEARALAPLSNVRAGLPPMLILQGDVDTETPLAGAQAFCAAMQAAGNECELKVYTGYGHLFTPAGQNDREQPNPDRATSAAATERGIQFLYTHGFLRRL